MGLGKTLQVISLIALLKQRSHPPEMKISPCLIVVPTSLLGNWQRNQFKRFAPQLTLSVVHRSVTTVEEIKGIENNPRNICQ